MLGGAGVVGVGLAVVAVRGIRARAAVATGLGRAGIAVPPMPRGWVRRTALTPLPVRPRRVTRVADLRYGDHRRQRLDVYHRRDLPTVGPVLVYSTAAATTPAASTMRGGRCCIGWQTKGGFA